MKINRLLVGLMCAALAIMRLTGFAFSEEASGEGARVEAILSNLSPEDKIAQMIMPAMRTWNGEKVTALSDAPELAEALRRHPYGGIILFGQNIVDAGQTVWLVSDLQANNAQLAGAVPASLPASNAVCQTGLLPASPRYRPTVAPLLP